MVKLTLKEKLNFKYPVFYRKFSQFTVMEWCVLMLVIILSVKECYEKIV